MEWDDLIDAIRRDLPYNEVKRGVEASLVGSMGRMAAHTGQVVTYDQILNGDHEFAPGLDKLTKGSPAPLLPTPMENIRFPCPESPTSASIEVPERSRREPVRNCRRRREETHLLSLSRGRSSGGRGQSLVTSSPTEAG